MRPNRTYDPSTSQIKNFKPQAIFCLYGKGGCEQRIKVFVKIQEINFGEGGVGGGRVKGGRVRVDVNEELKFL